MQVHLYRRECEDGEPFRRFLMSDLHLGSAFADVKRLKADLEMARRANARILINGDVFDAINPKDKRFAPSCIARPLRGLDDLGGGMVDLAVDLLSPYADLIDIIGIGNHEEAWVRRSAEDLVKRLIDRLNATLDKQGSENRIAHGGIMGFVRTTFAFKRAAGHSPAVNHTLLYQHGSGGDAPVTKGAIDAFRKQVQYEYDCLTFGHKHSSTYGRDAIMSVSSRGHLVSRDRIYIQTASYLNNIVRTTQARPLDYSYAESGHFSPKPKGGMFLILTPERIHRTRGDARISVHRVRQDIATSL